jgi:hypothetical protein
VRPRIGDFYWPNFWPRQNGIPPDVLD